VPRGARGAVDSGVRRSLVTRLLAVVVALLGSLSAPALGLAHDLEHAHVAREHGAGPHHDAPGRAVEAREADHHGHDHTRLDVAPAIRDLGRYDVAQAAAATPRAPTTVQATFVVVRSPALTDRALLARPDPGGGPPPTLRAPPAR
jgi:hypothetical protein